MIEMAIKSYELLDDFAANVRRRRKELGLTQVQAAERMGIQQPQWVRFERKLCSPNLRTLGEIAVALEIDPRKLLEHHESEVPA